jgi:hypothetical protein
LKKARPMAISTVAAVTFEKSSWNRNTRLGSVRSRRAHDAKTQAFIRISYDLTSRPQKTILTSEQMNESFIH